METTFAILNIVASLGIVIVLLLNRHRLVEQNILVSLGYNLMAIFSAIIVIKAAYNLSLDGLKSDIYGILFRVAALMYWLGSTQAVAKDGASVQLKSDESICIIKKPVAEPKQNELAKV